MDNGEFQAHTEQIEQLVQRVSAIQDDEARSTALDLLQSVMDLHGSAVARVVEVLGESGDSGKTSLAKLGNDPLICGLMVLYGVHPLDLDTRVANAIERVRPRLRKQGGTVELLGISDGVVRVKLQASGHNCGSSAGALEDLIQQAVLEVAPDAVQVIVEGAQSSVSGFVPLTTIQPSQKTEAQKEEHYEESAA
jgi:Fe-S cluster biogenesis protein NfuA